MVAWTRRYSEGGEKELVKDMYFDILKVEPVGFDYGLDVRYERKEY